MRRRFEQQIINAGDNLGAVFDSVAAAMRRVSTKLENFDRKRFAYTRMRAQPLHGMLLVIENFAHGTVTRGMDIVLKWAARGSTYDMKT